MYRQDRELCEKVAQVAWEAVWMYLDCDTIIGASVSGYVAQGASDGARAAFEDQFELPFTVEYIPVERQLTAGGAG